MDNPKTQGRELEVNWNHVLSVWWFLIWRGIVVSIVAGAATGLVVGIVAAVIGLSQETIGTLGFTFGLFGWPFVAVFVIRMALRKKYKTFRIALIAS